MIQLKRKEAIRLIKYHHLLHLSNEEKADIISDYNFKVKVYDKSSSLDFKEIQKYSNNKYILDRFSYNDLAYIIHSGFISGYQNRYGDNLKPPTNVYHRMTA